MKPDFEKNKLYYLILKDLYNSSNGLYPFTLYRRYKINVSEMFLFIKKYQDKGYVSYENDKLSLSSNGKEMIFSEIFHNRVKKGLESNLPEAYTGIKMDKNIPYIPIINYLAPEFRHKRKETCI